MGRASATGREVRGTNGKVSSGPASNAQRGPAAGSGGAVGPPPHGAQAERCSWRHRQRQPGGKARVWAGSPPCHCVESSYHSCLYFRKAGSPHFRISCFFFSPPHFGKSSPASSLGDRPSGSIRCLPSCGACRPWCASPAYLRPLSRGHSRTRGPCADINTPHSVHTEPADERMHSRRGRAHIRLRRGRCVGRVKEGACLSVPALPLPAKRCACAHAKGAAAARWHSQAEHTPTQRTTSTLQRAR